MSLFCYSTLSQVEDLERCAESIASKEEALERAENDFGGEGNREGGHL